MISSCKDRAHVNNKESVRLKLFQHYSELSRTMHLTITVILSKHHRVAARERSNSHVPLLFWLIFISQYNYSI